MMNANERTDSHTKRKWSSRSPKREPYEKAKPLNCHSAPCRSPPKGQSDTKKPMQSNEHPSKAQGNTGENTRRRTGPIATWFASPSVVVNESYANSSTKCLSPRLECQRSELTLDPLSYLQEKVAELHHSNLRSHGPTFDDTAVLSAGTRCFTRLVRLPHQVPLAIWPTDWWLWILPMSDPMPSYFFSGHGGKGGRLSSRYVS